MEKRKQKERKGCRVWREERKNGEKKRRQVKERRRKERRRGVESKRKA